MRYTKFICVALVTTYIQTGVFAQEIIWKKLASLPHPCASNGAAVIGNKIYYVAPDYSAQNGTKDFYVYDIAADKWEQLADIPGIRSNMVAEEVSGKIFVIGGDPFSSSNYVYSPETNTWDSLSPMPTARQHIDGAIVNNKIYVIGGITSYSNITKKNEVYDVASDTWEEKAPIPTLRNNPAVAVLDSLIYVIGGGGSETNIWTNIATVECYNPKTDKWTTKSNLPYKLFRPDALTINGKIFVLGGQNESGQSISSVLVYDNVNDQWKNITSLPKGNCFAGYAAVGNKIYVIGGSTSEPNWISYSDVYEGTVIGPFDYFGQTPPGNRAVKFAPGIISKSDRMEYKVAFSPDGNECLINVGEGSGYKVYYTKRENNIWAEQTIAPFSVNQSTEFSSFSVNGNKVFFDINEDIWMVERTDTGWGEAQKLPSPINTSSYESGYSETADSVIYFTSDRAGSIVSPFFKNLDIWRINKSTNQQENCGPVINSSTWDVTPCIAPDGSYLIYTKADGTNMGLFISFKNENDTWTMPLDMNQSGAEINILQQNSPYLSPDGKYLFFNRHDQDSADIYWVSTSIIDTLKKITFMPSSIEKIHDEDISIYPNPTKGLLKISFGTIPAEKVSTEVYNSEGKLIHLNFSNAGADIIDLRGNPKGIYYLKIIADGNIVNRKICLE